MRKINSRTSLDVGRRPVGFLILEISFPYKRKPARCHRTTVSGVTMMRDCFQPDQTRRETTQKSLSKVLSLGRRCRPIQHGELLSEHKVLQEKIPTAYERGDGARRTKAKNWLNMGQSYNRLRSEPGLYVADSSAR